MCTINAKLERPYEDRKFDGIFTIQAEMSQLAGAYVELGRYVKNGDLKNSVLIVYLSGVYFLFCLNSRYFLCF